MINVANEWGKLKEIIVGDQRRTPFPNSIDNVDLSFRLFYHDNLWVDDNTIKVKKSTNFQDITFLAKKIEEERISDIDEFVRTLQSMGIIVHRPNSHKLKIISSNYWQSLSSPAGTVRDQILIYMNNIIETAPQLRCRYFENEMLYDIFYEKFNNYDVNWLQMPKSRLADSNFDMSYATKVFESNTNGCYEFMFDAAQCLKFNEGVLVNCSTKNHDMGFNWLDRNFPNIFHKVKLVDSHLDGTIMPIADGYMIVGPKFYKNHSIEELPKWLHKWNIIKLDDLDKSDADKMCLASETIFVNCLPIGDKTVIINNAAINLRKKLEKLGFTVIPLSMRHDRLYGGSFHCISLDILRNDI